MQVTRSTLEKEHTNETHGTITQNTHTSSTMAQQPPQSEVLPLTSPSAELKPHPTPLPLSPSRLANGAGGAGGLASPSRLRSSSPRLHSPASSEIFERNVQEPVPIGSSLATGDVEANAAAAHIPSHVVTEDLIPPALEASAQAITSSSLNPDEVEIVTSTAHQQASSVLEQQTSGSTAHSEIASLNSPALYHARSSGFDSPPAGETPASSLHASGIVPSPPAPLHAAVTALATAAADDDTASSYGQLDPNDVRRLSFISFKDIVLSEHAHPAATTSGTAASPTIPASDAAAELIGSRLDRTTSPPTSTHSGVTTPPPPGVSVSPAVGGGTGVPGPHSELTIETMRQALRKTASGDLGAASGRGTGMSPVSDEASGSWRR